VSILFSLVFRGNLRCPVLQQEAHFIMSLFQSQLEVSLCCLSSASGLRYALPPRLFPKQELYLSIHLLPRQLEVPDMFCSHFTRTLKNITYILYRVKRVCIIKFPVLKMKT